MRARGYTENAKIISILGLSRGVGTTQLAVMLGVYLTKGRGCKTAIVEYGQHGTYEKFRECEKTKQVRLSTEAGKGHGFRSHGIDFYESISLIGFVTMLAERYDYVILDMRLEEGSRISTQVLGTFLQGQIRIGVASMIPWKLRECTIRLDKLLGESKERRLQLVSMTDSRARRGYAKKSYWKTIKCIPWEPDPFHMKAAHLLWLKNLVEQ